MTNQFTLQHAISFLTFAGDEPTAARSLCRLLIANAPIDPVLLVLPAGGSNGLVASGIVAVLVAAGVGAATAAAPAGVAPF